MAAFEYVRAEQTPTLEPDGLWKTMAIRKSHGRSEELLEHCFERPPQQGLRQQGSLTPSLAALLSLNFCAHDDDGRLVTPLGG